MIDSYNKYKEATMWNTAIKMEELGLLMKKVKLYGLQLVIEK